MWGPLPSSETGDLSPRRMRTCTQSAALVMSLKCGTRRFPNNVRHTAPPLAPSSPTAPDLQATAPSHRRRCAMHRHPVRRYPCTPPATNPPLRDVPAPGLLQKPPLRDVRVPVTRCQTPRYAMSDTPLRDVRVPVRDVSPPVTRCTGARARCQTPRYAMHGHPCAMSGPPCESSQQPLTATSSHAAGAVFPNPPPYSAALTNPPL
jgi:hypothetical protein